MVRIKHMRTRLNLVKEAADESRMNIKYIMMEEMLADGLMKSLAGGAFHEFSKMTLGGT